MLRKLWLIGLIVAAYFLYVNRLKLFIRDPLASMTRGGAFQEGQRAFINYDNDVLLENTRTRGDLLLVQHGQPVAIPAPLSCLLNSLCVANAYPTPQIGTVPGARVESMTSQLVQYKDSEGEEVAIKLH